MDVSLSGLLHRQICSATMTPRVTYIVLMARASTIVMIDISQKLRASFLVLTPGDHSTARDICDLFIEIDKAENGIADQRLAEICACQWPTNRQTETAINRRPVAVAVAVSCTYHTKCV
jgi:hypothetical protein